MNNSPVSLKPYLIPSLYVFTDSLTFPFIIHKNNKQLNPKHRFNLKNLIKQSYSKEVMTPLLAQSSLTYGLPILLSHHLNNTESAIISGTLSGLCEIKLTQHLANTQKRSIPLLALGPLLARDSIYINIFLKSDQGSIKEKTMGPLVAGVSTLPLDVATRNIAASRPLFNNFLNACKSSLGPRVAAIYTSMGAVLTVSTLIKDSNAH